MSLLSRISSFIFSTPRSQDSGMVERSLAPPGNAGGAIVSSVFTNRAGARRGTAEVLEAYRESPYLRAAVKVIGDAVASAEWTLWAQTIAATDNSKKTYVDTERYQRSGPRRRAMLRRESTFEEITAHPFFKLMQRPNRLMSTVDFMLVTVAHIELTGNAFWIIDVDDKGRPVRLWPIPPTWVTETPQSRVATNDSEAPVYVVSVPNGGIYEVPAEYMAHLRSVDVIEPYGMGSGTGMALGDEIDVDDQAAKMVSAFFGNSAIPAMIVSLKGASTPMLEAAKAKWLKSMQSFRKAYTTHFTGQELSVQRLDSSFKDMNLVELRRNQRDIVIHTIGIPPEKLGIIENSNLATSKAADITFAKQVLIPRLELIRVALQIHVVARYDTRLALDYADPVPADTDTQRAAAATMPGRLTVNEERSTLGLEPMADSAGEGYLVPQGVVFIKRLEDIAVKGNPVYGYHLAAGLLTNNEGRATLGLPPTAEEWGKERTVGFYSPYAGGGGDFGSVDTVDVDAEGAIMSATVNVRRGGKRRAKQGAGRRERAASYLSVKEIRRILRAVNPKDIDGSVGPVIEALIEQFGNDTITAIDDGITFDMDSDAVKTFLEEYAEDRIRELIDQTTKSQLRSALEVWDGEDDDELKDLVRDVFDVARIERSQIIAANEGGFIAGFADHEAMEQAGIVEEKEWITTMDGRERESHADMDGVVVGLTDSYKLASGRNAGAEAQWPRAFGIAGEDINCRCVSAPRISVEGEDKARREAILKAGCVVAGATPEERAFAWETKNAKITKTEAKLIRAFSAGFDKQEAAVLETLATILD